MAGYTAMRSQDLGVSWDMLHRDARRLAETVFARGPWKGVVTIPRGGLVPAGVVARELGLRRIETLAIASYDDQDQKAADILAKPPQAVAERGAGWLIVDDLVDSGQTAKLAREILPEATIATVYAKPDGLAEVDIFVERIPQDSWVYFPWDLGLLPTPPLVAGRA